ncbi:histidine phosphatase family protein [Paenibacillus sp. Marseille-Q4541]|uniref:histidine phosphatase family protein n=1 Tax=Paenibacillus sp. Marseille-Q4541 TaxID=2831522 RepID=UPI001BAB3DDF|nr:histidine phosphatase family protein [Paenibacillus sp. Marseille-Q4541]
MRKSIFKLFSVLMALFVLSSFSAGSVGASADNTVKKEDQGITFYLVRHGETIFNVQERMQGFSDSPLTEKGIEVAENLGRGLKDIPFMAAYTSTSERAVDTANLILKGRNIPLSYDKAIKEINFGTYEGEFTKDIFKKHPDILSNPNVFKPVGGESTAEVIDRMKDALARYAEENKNKEGNVLVVSHGAAILYLALALDPNSFDMSKGGLPNSSVTTIQWKDGKFKVLKVGDQSYAQKGEKKVRLYLVRHGETLFNTQNLMQGWSDSPLTKEGIEVAKYLGAGMKDIPFAAAYSSTSERSMDTADYILQGRNIPVHLNKGLKEMNFGTWEGKSNKIVEKEAPNFFDFKNFKSPVGGENYHELYDRTKAAIDQIIKENEENGGNVLVVSHGITIMNYILKLDPTLELKPLPNSSVTIVEWKNGKFTVETVGDQSYAEKGKALLHE